ncbi:MAG: hypothetical protein ACFFE8_03220 [Candidatus Heimdallarchaeota archaeon]
MHEKRENSIKYRPIGFVLPLWIVIWYLLGMLYFFILALPSVSNWSLADSITIEGLVNGSFAIKDGSILSAIFTAIAWPVILFALITVGWLLAGEMVGPGYDSTSPDIFVVYYAKLTQSFFPIILIAFASIFIAVVIVIIFLKIKRLG